MVPFFAKIFFLKMLSMSQPGSPGRKKQDTSSQKAKTGELGMPTPPAGYDFPSSPLFLRATCENDQSQPKFA
jgi:hypothetical protein